MPRQIKLSDETCDALEKLGDEYTSTPDQAPFILDTPEKVIGHLLFMALRKEENNRFMTVGKLKQEISNYPDDYRIMTSRDGDEEQVEWLEITGMFDASDEDSRMVLLYIDPIASIL